MVSLVAADSARDGADIVIAVDVTATNINGRTPATNQIPTLNSLSSFGIFENNIITQASSNKSNNGRSLSMRQERDRADIVITPDVAHISSIDTSQRRTLIAAGAQATTPQIEAIKQLMKAKISTQIRHALIDL